MQNLIRMANHIGDFFESMANRNEALEGVAMHLHKYWSPAMRADLLAQIDNAAAAGIALDLKPLVQESLSIHRTLVAVHHV